MTDNPFWRNRIVESGAADPQELAKGYNPDNWRFHPQIQRDALEDALDSIGVLQPVLFNKSSGRVIDGHLRIEIAILKGQPLIPVNYVELTDDEETLALATLDAITEQAEPIADKLAALLERTREMTADRPGLGAMLQALRLRTGMNGQAIDPMAEWQGMPEFNQEDLTAFRTIHVHFNNQEDIDVFAELVGQKITENKRFIWYPEAEIGTYKDKRYS